MQQAERATATEPLSWLTPDANFSRNVSFHVITDPEGRQSWMGRYLLDLIEVAAEHHPEGLLVEIDGFTYLVTVAPAQKDLFHGKSHSPPT